MQDKLSYINDGSEFMQNFDTKTKKGEYSLETQPENQKFSKLENDTKSKFVPRKWSRVKNSQKTKQQIASGQIVGLKCMHWNMLA